MITKTSTLRYALGLILMGIFALSSCTLAKPAILRLASTTGTYDSGLLDAILPGFESQFNARVDVAAIGTLQAIKLGENPRALSSGEIQRVALARTLVLEPELLLLDMPTANLDTSNAAMIEAIINEVRGQQKTTIILISHNLSQANRLADRTAMVFSGKIIEVIEGGDILEAARDPRTRAYIEGTFPY